MIDARTAAGQRAVQASITLDEAAFYGRRTGPVHTVDASAPALRSTLRNLAQRHGVAVSALQANTGGGVTVQITNSPADAVYAWLIELEQGRRIVAGDVWLSDRGDGFIAGQVSFAPLDRP